MKNNVVMFDVNYKNNSKLNKRTMQILNRVKGIFGLEQVYEDLMKYASYINLKQKGLIDFGSYNLLIKNRSEYKSTTEIVDIVRDLLLEKNIIKTSYRYITKDDLKSSSDNSKEEKCFTEELIIIDNKIVEMDLGRNSKEVIPFMEKNRDKVFILVENNTDTFRIEGMINARFWDYITWEVDVKQISKEEKERYIGQLLKKNEIKIDERNTFIEAISKEPFWEVLRTMKNIILDCKIKKITVLTDDNLKKEYKEKYAMKGCKNSNKSPRAELNSLIGMKNVKEQIEQITNYIKVNGKRKNMPALHMVFTGNPGTGKTTVARIIGKIFSEMKILSDKNIFVESQRCDLIGEYVGQTAPKTEAVIEKATGGVLFIDEAYTLSTYIQDEAGRDYGAECIATLIKEMEDKRDKLCVILAGYTNEMEKMLKCNPGFESRIQFKINFPDYSEEELYEIFKFMAKKENYKISSNIKQLLLDYFTIEKQKENFANARCVRNIFEKIKFEQANRVAKDKAANINLITKSDIQNVVDKYTVKKIEKRQIGF